MPFMRELSSPSACDARRLRLGGMTPRHSYSEFDSYIEGATGLRGFACALVLGVHASALVFPSSSPYLAGCGKIGVWLFFVLSAFLLTCRLEARGFSTRSLADYALGRFLRIIPPFVVIVLLYFWLGTAHIDKPKDIYNALLFKRGYDHLWTIPVEFKAYAVIPLFAWSVLKIRAICGEATLVLALLAAIAAHQAIYPYTDIKPNSIDTVWYLPAFLLGSGAAALLPWWRKLPSRFMLPVAAACLLLVVVVTPAFRFFAFGTPPGKELINQYLYFSLVWAVFILAIVAHDGRLRAIASSRGLVLIGLWSYSIYLSHWYFLIKLREAMPNSFAGAALGVAASIACGCALHYAIERPCDRLRRLSRRYLPKATASGTGRHSVADAR